jgi:ABC-2 type transport system ATP-binding protein
MIEIKKLSRSFGTLRAVDDINFSVHNGSITGFLGPNGAGKTTTLRMMVSYLKPDSGSISIDGKSIYDEPIETSAKIGYLPEQNPLYEDMLVMELLQYIADLRKMSPSRFQERSEYVISNCGINRVLYQKIGTLSKGFRQRVGLALAILHDPEILILDEPTSGLDPNQIIEIRDLIRKLGVEKTVILSSHIMQEVQALCDRVLIINNGKIIVDDDIDNVSRYFDDYLELHLEIQGENIDLQDFLDFHPELEVISLESHDQICKLILKCPSDSSVKHDLSRYVSDNGWLIENLYTKQISLEEIFFNLTKTGALPHKSDSELVQDPSLTEPKTETPEGEDQ